MKLRTPSHATVVAYLALFVAIGGSAYAVSKIGSAQIENRSIKGKDVADDTLRARQIDEPRLSGPVAVGDARSTLCDPPPGTEIECIRADLRLKATSAVFIVATARPASDGTGVCLPKVDGGASNGQSVSGNGATIAITTLSTSLSPGPHSVALACRETGGDLTVDDLAISAVAVDNALFAP